MMTIFYVLGLIFCVCCLILVLTLGVSFGVDTFIRYKEYKDYRNEKNKDLTVDVK